MVKVLGWILALLAYTRAAHAAPSAANFVHVNRTQLELNGKPYHFIGANYWYGINLAAAGPGGDLARLRRELDQMAALGLKNLRVMAGSEGPDASPYRMTPSLQSASGVYNEAVFRGLDLLLHEMALRGMHAVVCLGNFWHWSGGFAQYVQWAGGGPIPYPADAGWEAFQDYAGRFYTVPAARQAFQKHVQTVVGRVNHLTGVAYKDDPTIMTWQLANEPSERGHTAAYLDWMQTTRNAILSLDPQHLITTGSEGPEPYSTANDYLSTHVWIQNWGWYDPTKPATYLPAKQRALAFLSQQDAAAKKLGKPLVLEEFGLARDQGSFSPAASTTLRDDYYAAMFAAVLASQHSGGALVGANIWAWSGEGRPRAPGGLWHAGDPWTGDPAHEPQGWYSVYDADKSTQQILRVATEQLSGRH